MSKRKSDPIIGHLSKKSKDISNNEIIKGNRQMKVEQPSNTEFVEKKDDFIWMKNLKFNVEVIESKIIKIITNALYYFKLKFSSNYMKIVNEISFKICINHNKIGYIPFDTLQLFVNLLKVNQSSYLIINDNIYMEYILATNTLSCMHVLNNMICPNCRNIYADRYFSIKLDEKLKQKLIEALSQVIDKINHHMAV